MIDVKTRALIVIDSISSVVSDQMHPGFDTKTDEERDLSCLSREQLEKKYKEGQRALETIYRFSHALTGSCLEHHDWIDEFKRHEQELIHNNQIPNPCDVQIDDVYFDQVIAADLHI